MRLRGNTLQRLAPRAPGGDGRLAQPRRRLLDRLGYRTRTLGLAGLLAALAVVLTLAYVRSYRSGVDAAAGNVPVFVATRDIPAGTPGAAVLRRDLVATEDVPRRAVVPGAISARRQIADLVAVEPIYAGEQITVRRFAAPERQGMRGRIDGTLRAFAVAGEANQVLAGVLRDGDRVDVVASASATGGESGGRPLSRVILRDVLVLRAAAETAAEGPGGRGGTAVVLGLTDRQAQKLFYAVNHGQWALLLRPLGRAADSPERLENLGTVFGEGVGTG